MTTPSKRQELPTITVSGGAQYVQVKDRVIFFNENFPNGKIENIPTISGEMVLCSCKVTPDMTKPDRYFTGHSWGTLKGEKSLEYQETVAVGRALAMMGIGVIEGIASADEMRDVNMALRQSKPASVAKPVAKRSGTGREFGPCPLCEEEGREIGTLRERVGKNGPFVGCSSYPTCRYTSSVKAFDDNGQEIVDYADEEPLK